MSELFTLSFRVRSATLQRKLILAACIRNLMTIGEGQFEVEDRGLSQTFPVLVTTFWVYQLPPPSDPTNHQMVISLFTRASETFSRSSDVKST